MLQLSQINIFPVKSLDGFSPKSAIVTKRGLQYDRRWMITEPDGKFMTQRKHGRMALLKATIEDNSLVIKEKQSEDNCIKMPLNMEGRCWLSRSMYLKRKMFSQCFKRCVKSLEPLIFL